MKSLQLTFLRSFIEKVSNWQFQSNHKEINEIMAKIDLLAHEMEHFRNIFKGNLLQFKNNFPISDAIIHTELPYNDLTPAQAYGIYIGKQTRSFVIDVSHRQNPPPSQILNSIHVPLEYLPESLDQYKLSKSNALLIISENGTRSILACELLARHEYYNLSNVSGGHIFWPGHRSP